MRTERKIEEVPMLLHVNRSQSEDDRAEAIVVGISLSRPRCCKILTDDLNMSRVTKHSLPRILTQNQRDYRMTIYGNLVNSADEDPTFLNWIITGDES